MKRRVKVQFFWAVRASDSGDWTWPPNGDVAGYLRRELRSGSQHVSHRSRDYFTEVHRQKPGFFLAVSKVRHADLPRLLPYGADRSEELTIDGDCRAEG